VGINTAIFSRSGGSVGIGFAIPVNMVKAVIRSSVATGRVVRPWSGVEIQEVTADIAQALGFDRPVGALVSDLHPLSPLNEAGLRRGDVIVALNDRPIESTQEFNYRLATAPVERDRPDHLPEGRQPPYGRGEAYCAAGAPAAPGNPGARQKPVCRPRHRQFVAGGCRRTGLAGVGERRGGSRRARRAGAAGGLPPGRCAWPRSTGWRSKQSTAFPSSLDRRGNVWEIAVERGGRLIRMQVAG
jgi:hypothetical protein